MIFRISAGINPPPECTMFVNFLYDSLYKEFNNIRLIDFKKSRFTEYYNSITFISDDDNIRSILGTIEWICESQLRKGHKRKNWFINISEIPEVIIIDTNTKDIKIDTFRSSGKGGQSVNTTNSAVRITHIPTGIVVENQDERSQYMNKKKCLEELNYLLNEKQKQNEAFQNNESWKLGNNVIRGNPIRIYEGKDFKLKK